MKGGTSIISLLPNPDDPQVVAVIKLYRELVRTGEKLVYVKAYKRKGPASWYDKGGGPKPLPDDEMERVRAFEKQVKVYAQHVAVDLRKVKGEE